MVCAPPEITLPYGRLRRFLSEDMYAFAELNADPVVMEFFPRPWSFTESEAAFRQITEGFNERGFGIYALDSKGEFSGFVGLSVPSFKTHFTPCVEILWRLNPRFWGQGLVTTAAREVLNMAFRQLKLAEVVAFAVVENQRSVRVMERIGMTRHLEPFFDHPTVTDNQFRRHVLYKAARQVHTE